MEDRLKKAKRRFDEVVRIRQDYEPLWKDVTDLLAIRRSDIDQTDQPGKKKGMEIFDGTPKAACQMQADGYYGYLCSPTMEWFRLKMGRKELNAIPEVKQYLQEAGEQMYYALNRSNFYEQAPLFFFDGCSIGTATMYAEEVLGTERIAFMTRAPGEVYISHDRFGQVDVLFRKYKLSARNLANEFGLDKLTEKSQNLAKNLPETLVECVHGTFPNDDRQLGKVDAKNKKVASVYFESTGALNFLRESGYEMFPFFVWRYRVDSGETYGRSPATDAIVEIFTLNQVSKTALKAGQLALEPAYNVPQEMKGQVRITPRGENYYKDHTRLITPIHVPLNYQAGKEQQERLSDSIEKHFHTEFFMLLSKAALEGRQLNVPQVMEMQGEKGAMLGAVVGRLNGDFFDNAIDRLFHIENVGGRMPRVPDIIYEMGESVIDVEYLGPLAQAQKQLVKTQGILKGMQLVAPMMEMFPEMRDRVNSDNLIEEIFDSVNFPQTSIIPIDKANETRQARAQKMQQQEQMAMMSEMADKAPGLSKKVDQDSIIGKMTEGA